MCFWGLLYSRHFGLLSTLLPRLATCCQRARRSPALTCLVCFPFRRFHAVISWLNKQLNDGVGPVRRFTVDKYKPAGIAGIAADVTKPRRAPFGTKTASELNKRQVHYKGKVAGGAGSAGSSRNPSPASFEQYLPKQIGPVDLDSQKEDARYVVPSQPHSRPSSSCFRASNSHVLV